ncbi:MAG: glutamate racemase [Owenweeksia sp.]
MAQPIGIFDSGVGGLTVAAAIKKHLPDESFIYFGDTRHSPYGDKSRDTIQTYSTEITEFLLDQNCKAIVIACNTASALAYKKLISKFSEVPIVNVIDPVVDYVAENAKGKVGIIATRATTQSGIYKKSLLAKKPKLNVVTAATPLLVGIAEEDFTHTDISRGAIRAYLDNDKFRSLSSLILGCTHFPLFQTELESFYQGKTEVVDSPELVAHHLKAVLVDHKINNKSKGAKVNYQFYVSEKTKAFTKIARNFFGEDITLTEKVLS